MENARIFHRRNEEGKEIWSVIFDSPDFESLEEAEKYRDRVLNHPPQPYK